ncbi:hypothetical protein QF028_002453 [Neobacillus sp. B4I6]|uniref:hypothetical protein n=1 Tax=Neobacillus sp. B4I6 TaxID=3373925 RepID=UPI003D1AB783
MAQDKNMPRMFANRGDRLAFNYGIITLGILASFLLIVFGGRTEALIPLYWCFLILYDGTSRSRLEMVKR